MTKYCFVLDADGKQLSPTKEKKGWYMVRTGKARLVSKYPMTIQLNKSVPAEDIDHNEVRCGIDDGGLHVGVSLVEKCATRNKVLFKGTVELRDNVKRLLDARRNHRRLRRHNKRYRAVRFNNRKRRNAIAPSILQKKQAILRVANALSKAIRITGFYLEDVMIDYKAAKDARKVNAKGPLDGNIRMAVIQRDGFRCMCCGKQDVRLEVHHIMPRRLGGTNQMGNLISLCKQCHQTTEHHEEDFMSQFYKLIDGGSIGSRKYAAHVMTGKRWLRSSLSDLAPLRITSGGETANKRAMWGVEKSHSNDAVCITGLRPDTVDVEEWVIKPMRKKSKAKTSSVSGFRHRDYVEYTFRNGETHRGYVTALYPEANAINFQSPAKHCKKVNANKCKLLWRYTKIYWFPVVA